MQSAVLNNLLGSHYVFDYPALTKEQESEIMASLFEQLLIFDKITLTTSRLNFTLIFLINKIGINNVERLIDSGYIDFLLWSPMIITSTGMRGNDGSIDESVIYGKSPIVAGSLSAEDLDPEKNIMVALSKFELHRDRKRIFARKALKHYTVPDGMLLAGDAANFVIDSYKNNNLDLVGLPYSKEPDQMNVEERRRLLELGHKIIETAILSLYGLKSYENYEPYQICRKNIEIIGKAYNISANTTKLFKIENVPDLKQLFLTEKLDFESVFKIRHFANAKYYRKWINEVGENSNAQEVSKEYLNQIKGTGKYFEKTKGKLLKNLSSFGVNSAIGAAIAGPIGTVVGLGVGLLETLWVDSILKGKNPSMFIDDIRNEIAPDLMPDIHIEKVDYKDEI
jgi:hypothetical protein